MYFNKILNNSYTRSCWFLKMFSKARNFICTTILAPPAYRKLVFQPRLAIVNMRASRLSSNAPIPDASTAKVFHDPVGQEFKIEFSNKCRAFLIYEMEGNTIKIMHTEVPQKFEGKGFGKVLAQAALQHIEKHQYRAEAYCDYFRHYVEKYEPKYLKYFEN